MLHHGGRKVSGLYHGGRQAKMLLRGRRQIYPGRPWLIPVQLVTTGDVLEDGERWAQWYFDMPMELTGTAAAGWTNVEYTVTEADSPDAVFPAVPAGLVIPAGQTLMRLRRSENLTTWDHDFIPATGYPVENSDGTWTYAARSKYPLDSEYKLSQLTISSLVAEDSRNQPFTSVVLGDVVQDLPNFPYQMPTDAAQLQTDLRAAGFTGTTVTSSAWNVWEILIPDVASYDYAVQNKIGWPLYLVANLYGEIVNPVAGRDFTATSINAAGVSTAVGSQFACLDFTPNT